MVQKEIEKSFRNNLTHFGNCLLAMVEITHGKENQPLMNILNQFKEKFDWYESGKETADGFYWPNNFMVLFGRAEQAVYSARKGKPDEDAETYSFLDELLVQIYKYVLFLRKSYGLHVPNYKDSGC